MKYLIQQTDRPPVLSGDWLGPAWSMAKTLSLDLFRPESSAHHPRVEAKLLYCRRMLHGIFRVDDRYIRCLTTENQGPVWCDSCVEFFVQPLPTAGYFNFEFNCGGAFLCHYRTMPDAPRGGPAAKTVLGPEECAQIQVYHSMPRTVDPELEESATWILEFAIPLGLLERYVGALPGPGGQTWRGNFYKCADGSSHPHWASWAPLRELNFHMPVCFGSLHFTD